MNLFLYVALAVVLGGLGTSFVFSGWVRLITSPKFTFDDIPDLSGKVAIVTGANTGIGKVSARELARKGAHVIVACRSTPKGIATVNEITREIPKANVEYMNLDLSSMANVQKFTDVYLAKGLGIDILMLNAGIMMNPFELTEDKLESQFATNHIGHFLMVQNLLPVLVQSKARVVSVSSLAHTFVSGIDFNTIHDENSYDKVKAYGVSKLSNVLFASELARRYGAVGVTSYSVHPGLVATELMRHVDADFFKLGGHDGFAAKVYTWVKDSFNNALALDPNGGALTQLFVATAPSNVIEQYNGAYYSPIALRIDPSAVARDEVLAKKLYDYSLGIVKPFLH